MGDGEKGGWGGGGMGVGRRGMGDGEEGVGGGPAVDNKKTNVLICCYCDVISRAVTF